MVKSYFLAPNFTTAPPPEGPIKLGSILHNIREFRTINRTVQAIPVMQLQPVDKETGFEIFLGQRHSVDFGLIAQVLGLLGLGTSASIERTKDRNNLLSCQRLDTFAFDPTESYINKSMEDSRVRSFLRSSRFKLPMYMVTGLKVARGASLVGVGEKWDSSTDFIVAFKVRKIWLDRDEEVKHAKMAVIADGTYVIRQPTFTIRSDDDLTPK
ncbi:hypothetical protein AUP68_07018 [Ilyonectria robusta]